MVASFQYKNEQPAEPVQTYAKSIRFQANGFCIAIYRYDTRHILSIEQYDFPEGCSLDEKVALIAETEKKWDTKGNAFLTYFTRINTQIPEFLHDERNSELYLPLLTPQPYDYIPMEETIGEFELFNVSGWDKELYGKLQTAFPKYTFRSGTSVLMKILSRMEGKRKMLVFLENEYMCIAAVEGDKMLGANGFTFDNKNDFLYYLVAFAQVIYKDTNELYLYMGGNIEENSLLYPAVKKYFSEVRFVDPGYPITNRQLHRFCDLLLYEGE